jgi:hypothetical protein
MNPTAGLAAGWLMALCAPLIFYENLLLRESTIAFMTILIAWAWSRAPFHTSSDSWLRWSLLFGVLCGFAWMLKTTFVPMIGILFCTVVYKAWKKLDAPASRIKVGAALVLGVALAISPFVYRNVAVGVKPTHFTSVGALNAISALCANSPLGGMDFNENPLGLELLEKSEGRFGLALVEALKTHSGPGSVIVQVGRKLNIAVNTHEIPDNATIDYFRLFSSLLTWLPVSMVLLVPLGVLGIWASVVKSLKKPKGESFASPPLLQSIWPLWIFIALNLLPVLVFNPLGRYRIAFVALLLVFAALGVAQLAEWIGAEKKPSLSIRVCAAAGLLALGIWAALPIPFVPIRGADYELGWKLYYKKALIQMAENRNTAGMAYLAEELFASRPAWLEERAREKACKDAAESNVAFFFWRMRQVMLSFKRSGLALSNLGPDWLDTLPAAMDKSDAASVEEVLAKANLESVSPETLSAALGHFNRAVQLDAERTSARLGRAQVSYMLAVLEKTAGRAERAEVLRQSVLADLEILLKKPSAEKLEAQKLMEQVRRL